MQGEVHGIGESHLPQHEGESWVALTRGGGDGLVEVIGESERKILQELTTPHQTAYARGCLESSRPGMAIAKGGRRPIVETTTDVMMFRKK